MMIKTLVTFSQIIALCSTLFLGACKDQNNDEYQQAQLNQQLARLQAVSGSYKGSITNQTTGANLGNIEIDLSSVTTPSSSTNAVTSSSQANLLGSIILYQGPTVANKVDFDNPIHYYSDDNSGLGSFTGTVTVPMTGSTTSAKLTVQGTINNGVFSGTITQSPSEPTGVFRAVLGAPFPSSDGQASSFNGDPTTTQINSYSGVLADLPGCVNKNTSGQCPVLVDLNVSYIAPTQGEAFLNNFQDRKLGAVTLKFLDAQNPSRTIVNIAFSPAQIDLFSGEISGVNSSTGDVPTEVTLNCTPVPANPKAKNCTMHTISNGVTIPFLVSPVSAK